MRNYKFRLYPTSQQETLLKATTETCRRLYNSSLDERSKNYVIHFYEQKRLLTERRKQDKYQEQVHSQVLHDVLLRLDKAYEAFFKKLSKYPKFKSKEKYNSFSYPQYGGFRCKDNKLILSCIGSIGIKMHRIPVGTMKRCTILRDVGQWYCCITTDDGIKGVKVEAKINENAIGVDVGLLNWIILSNGAKITNTLDFEAHSNNIKKLQRCLSRKKKGSKNREKVRVALAKAWRQVRRCRDDFVHKTSKIIADEYTMIVFEKLNINNMVKNHNLAQAILDATWGKLRQYTAYKVERRGGQMIVVNPNGTSQKCSMCEVVAEEKLDLSTYI